MVRRRKAGIQRGDVIVEYNGRPVTDSDSLVAMVVATKPGTTVPITIYRDNQRKTLNITPDELDLEAEANGGRSTAARRASPNAPTATDFGMQLEAITPEIARAARASARPRRRDRRRRRPRQRRRPMPACSRTTSSSR